MNPCDLQGFDHPVENQADPYRGDEEPDDARGRVNAHRPDSLRQPLGIGQAEIGDAHVATIAAEMATKEPISG